MPWMVGVPLGMGSGMKGMSDRPRENRAPLSTKRAVPSRATRAVNVGAS